LYLISLWKVLPLISCTSGEISLRRVATRASGDKPVDRIYSDGIDLSEVPEQELFDACTRCGAQRTDARPGTGTRATLNAVDSRCGCEKKLFWWNAQ
jgi:hypothetical protein